MTDSLNSSSTVEKNSCFNKEFEGDVNHVLPLETIRELSEMQDNTYINDNISADENLKCVKLLKNNKTCGEDLLYNEYTYYDAIIC